MKIKKTTTRTLSYSSLILFLAAVPVALLVIATSATSSLAQGGGIGGGGYSGPSGNLWGNTPNADRYAPKPRPMHINPNFPEVPRVAASLPKGATRVMVRSDADARRIFTYSPYPLVPAQPGAAGVYRLEVNSQGAVAAVTILKSMGSAIDVTAMKTFVQWRAKPGPFRIVDISWVMSG